MPAPRPEEFRRRAVELARLREKRIAQIAKDLGIAPAGWPLNDIVIARHDRLDALTA